MSRNSSTLRNCAMRSRKPANSFPNCFFLGFTQTAVTISVPHALNEQARHVAYILDEAEQRGAQTVEALLFTFATTPYSAVRTPTSSRCRNMSAGS